MTRSGRVASWPLWVLAAPAFVAIWTGWVGLGTLTGFGMVQPLPGVWDALRIDSRALLPLGVEAYAALALRAWLDERTPRRARAFARRSAIGSLTLGAGGQVIYHLMVAAGLTHAPWPVTAAVACLPVAVLGMGAALAHLLRADLKIDLPTEMAVAPVAAGPATKVRPPALSGDVVEHDTAGRVLALAAAQPELSNDDLAARLGCSTRTVRRHLAADRARRQQVSASRPADRSDDQNLAEHEQLREKESA